MLEFPAMQQDTDSFVEGSHMLCERCREEVQSAENGLVYTKGRFEDFFAAREKNNQRKESKSWSDRHARRILGPWARLPPPPYGGLCMNRDDM